MNNLEIAHLWANRSRPSGKGSHFYFEGDTIYSYGPHFPAARLFSHPVTGQTCALITTGKRSLTTTRHVALIRQAVSHLTVFGVTNVTVDVSTLAKLNDVCADSAAWLLSEAECAKAARRESARRNRARVKLDKANRLAFPAELGAWRLGGLAPKAGFLTGTALRIVGRAVETSASARVPLAAARRAWPVLLAAVRAEEANPTPVCWEPFFSAPDFKWGDYQGISLRRVDFGSPMELVVGCHRIPWDEVAGIAAKLGL